MKEHKILFVANEAKEHIMKFHQPTMQMMLSEGWIVDVACGGKVNIPYCDNQYELPICRSPFHSKLYKGYKQLKNIVDNGDYDIVYCHTTVGVILARLAARYARKKGTKVINFAHGTYFYKSAPLTNWLYYPLYKYLSTVTDVIITITQEDFDFTKKHFSHAKTFFVNGIGVDTERFKCKLSHTQRVEYRNQLNIPIEATVLIYCAELIQNKNQKLLIDSLNMALRKKSKIYLLLVGIDHNNGEYEKYAKSLGVNSHVRFLGWRNDIAQLYNASDICVASSIREGFGLNLVEAMLCGMPVIATNNSGHASIIKEGYNGSLVELNSPQLFANKIIELSNNVILRENFVKNALKDIDKYSSSSILKELRNIFYTTISGS
ncbi:glycosyltransferase [Parabacteroides goldsteinii]|jgi:glycosyltransferase EpsD|uniref:glycosyltransferase n=1 Tax=Parabacteroides goldsteinii TaxID=328812 RepID=UPI001D438556|nr:glycosyltransferase [Parabacteroides goldsteinii]MBS6577749.1 glycosyltransferase [Parabacteroides goldsteinii]